MKIKGKIMSNGDGENVTVYDGHDDEEVKKGIALAREIGRERAACRAPIKDKIRYYLVKTDDADDR